MPFVSSVELSTVTLPSPRSVAKAAELAPWVVTLRFLPTIIPPYVASKPLAPLDPIVVIVELVIVILLELPDAKTALLAMPVV